MLSTPTQTAPSTPSDLRLYGSSQDGVSLQGAIAKVCNRPEFANAIGLFYSPEACTLGLLQEDGNVQTLHQPHRTNSWQAQTVDLSRVFEARIFCTRAELSWLNLPGQAAGRAVLLHAGEQAAAEAAALEQPLETLIAVELLSQQYLLWGFYDSQTESLGAELQENWTIVSTGQIGALAVPIAAAASRKKQAVVLHCLEYLTVDGDGNAYVAYERLLNLDWNKQEQKND